MLAARWNTSRIIDTLLDAGADIAIKDDEGRQAADYAQENRNLKSRYVQTRLKGEETGVQRHIDEKSDERSNPVVQFIAGLMGGRGRDASTAASYRQAAEQGDAEAARRLALMYYEGEGLKQSYAKAAKWFRSALKNGDAEAPRYLGLMYAEGLGVGQNFAKAAECFREAAERGDAWGQFNLGVLYYGGEGVEQDYTKAMEWYGRAVEQGLASAQFNLGLMYEQGRGVKQDYARAAELYRRGAEQGDSVQKGMGRRTGRHGGGKMVSQGGGAGRRCGAVQPGTDV